MGTTFGWTTSLRTIALCVAFGVVFGEDRGRGEARGRAERTHGTHRRCFEFVEVVAPVTVISSLFYAVSKRMSKRLATVTCIVVGFATHGVWCTIGLVAVVTAFALSCEVARSATYSVKRKRAYVFVVSVILFIVIDELERSATSPTVATGIMRTTFNAYRAFRYDVLRMLSYGIDVVEGVAAPSLGVALRYVMYPPLRQCGPIVFYREFERHTCAGDKRRFGYALRELADCFAWYAMLDYATRTYYSSMMAPDDGLFTNMVHAWTHTTAIWASPTIIFNFNHALAVFDGQVSPRDVSVPWTSSGTSFTNFWRTFHTSLHELYVHYIHRPFGSNTLSVVIVMGFSLLFHGIRDTAWWVFFIVNCVGVVIERTFTDRYPAAFEGFSPISMAMYQAFLFAIFTACSGGDARMSHRNASLPLNVLIFWSLQRT